MFFYFWFDFGCLICLYLVFVVGLGFKTFLGVLFVGCVLLVCWLLIAGFGWLSCCLCVWVFCWVFDWCCCWLAVGGLFLVGLSDLGCVGRLVMATGDVVLVYLVVLFGLLFWAVCFGCVGGSCC